MNSKKEGNCVDVYTEQDNNNLSIRNFKKKIF